MKVTSRSGAHRRIQQRTATAALENVNQQLGVVHLWTRPRRFLSLHTSGFRYLATDTKVGFRGFHVITWILWISIIRQTA